MAEKKRIIKLGDDDTAKILAEYPISRGYLSRILNFTSDSLIAQQVRLKAIQLDPNCYYETKEPSRDDLCSITKETDA